MKRNNPRRGSAGLQRFIEGYLYTTGWGKHYARPSQIRAAAKQIQRSGRLPKPVADALQLKAA